MASPSTDAPLCSCCGAAMRYDAQRGVWACGCHLAWRDTLHGQSSKLGKAIEAYLKAEIAAKRKKASNG